jgi:hypothetical protein
MPNHGFLDDQSREVDRTTEGGHPMTHAWCRDPSRDERVRAAEDGRDRPLPTLEQCIDGMFPKSVSESSAPDQENKGDGMGVTESLSADEGGEEMAQVNCADAAERSSTVSKTGDGQSKLRTERVTLEVTYRWLNPPSKWNWNHVITSPMVTLKEGESVRVVEVPVGSVDDRAYADSMACDEERDFANRILAERDAAIRERDEARQSWLRSEESGTRLLAQRNAALDDADGLRKRVAELEAHLKILDDGQPTAPSDLGIWGTAKELSARCQELAARLVCVSTRATAAEARVAELEAASGGGEGAVANVTFHADDSAERARYVGMTVKPLRRPQPRGWLTGEERRFVYWWAHENRKPTDEELDAFKIAAKALLARSTPPEVRLPLADLGDRLLRDSVIHALAEAGVAVKGVGRE